MPKLVIRVEGQEARSFPLDADTVKIGSGEGSGIRIPSPDISREHCEIRRAGLQYRLVDLESKVGSKVNGIYVNQHTLEEGDEIELGSIKLRFERDVARNGHGVPPQKLQSRRPSRPARPQRHARPPRTNTVPLVVACVVVVVVLIAVLVMAGGPNDSKTSSHNAEIHQQVRDLERLDRLEEALAMADRADPASDRETYERIERLAQSIRMRLSPGGTPASGDVRAREDAQVLLARIDRRRNSDPGQLLTAVDDYLARYSYLKLNPYVEQVRAERPMLLVRSRGERGESGESGESASDDDVATRFVKAQKEVDDLIHKRHYGKALDVYGDYLDRNQAFFKNQKEREDFTRRVEKGKAKIMEYANSAWEETDTMAKKRLAQDAPYRALKLYRRVVEEFGIPIMEEQAAQAIRRIKGR